MSPMNKEEWGQLRECTTRIQHLEETIKDLKQEIMDLRKEKKETQNRISDRRLAIYLAFASIIGGVVVAIIQHFIK